MRHLIVLLDLFPEVGTLPFISGSSTSASFSWRSSGYHWIPLDTIGERVVVEGVGCMYVRG